jgi:hypothetical protein
MIHHGDTEKHGEQTRETESGPTVRIGAFEKP